MDNVSGTETGWRGSRDLWLTMAYESLLENGIDAVRIQAMGKRLGLSRTSFYWFFTDREALLASLLEMWRERNSKGLIKQTLAYAESVAEAMLNIVDCWLDPSLFDSKLEFAVRSWGLQSNAVTKEVEAADISRIGAIAELFIRFGMGAVEADVRARTIYLTQIGYISMKTQEDLATRMGRIPSYVEIFGGVSANTHELARFYARHSYSLPPGGVGLTK